MWFNIYGNVMNEAQIKDRIFPQFWSSLRKLKALWLNGPFPAVRRGIVYVFT